MQCLYLIKKSLIKSDSGPVIRLCSDNAPQWVRVIFSQKLYCFQSLHYRFASGFCLQAKRSDTEERREDTEIHREMGEEALRKWRLITTERPGFAHSIRLIR